MRKLLKLLLWLVVGAGILLLAFIFQWITSIGSAVPTVITKTVEGLAPPPANIEVSPVMIINAMEDKFETTTFSMNLTAEEVTAGRCGGNLWQDLAYRDCLKMSVPGVINAGFGRSILDRNRIQSGDKTVIFDLGSPIIQNVIIGHARVRVLNPDDDGGWLTDPDKNLQAQAFAIAEKKLSHIACRAGILRSAAHSAEIHYGTLIRTVLKAAGDERVVKITYTVPVC